MNNYDYSESYSGPMATSAMSIISGIFIIIWVLGLVLNVIFIVSQWKVFKKAGKPGWASIVPIYKYIVMCEIAQIPSWYVILFFIPLINIYAFVKVCSGIAKRFGKETGFTIGLVLLPFIFFPILAFGKDSIVDNNEVSSSGDQNTSNNETETLQMPEDSNVSNSQVYKAPTFDTPVNDVNNNIQTNFVAPSFDNNVQSTTLPNNEQMMQNNNSNVGINEQVNNMQSMESSLNTQENVNAVDTSSVNGITESAMNLNTTLPNNEQMMQNNSFNVGINDQVNNMQSMESSLNTQENVSAVDTSSVNGITESEINLNTTLPNNEQMMQNNNFNVGINEQVNNMQSMESSLNTQENVSAVDTSSVNGITESEINLNTTLPNNEQMMQNNSFNVGINDQVNNNIQSTNQSSSNEEMVNNQNEGHTSLWSNNNQNNGQM